jgi:hypothetical protein
MRTALKRAAVSMYCRGALPATCVAWLFRVFDLRAK